MSSRENGPEASRKLVFSCEFCGKHCDSYMDLADHYDNEHGGMRP